MKNNYESHTFWCPQCGQENFPLQRKVNHKHAKHHRKKLWCWHCKREINCIECKNDQEIKEFKDNFLAGKYQKELEESLNFINKEQLIWA